MIAEPSSTASPFTSNTAREVSVLSATTRVNTYSPIVVSSAAVTVTTSVFSPTTRSTSPTISTVASGSVVSTATSTASVPPSSSIVSPSTASLPLIVMLLTVTSVLKATFNRTMYSVVLSSAAVTVRVNVFSPGTSSASPDIS